MMVRKSKYDEVVRQLEELQAEYISTVTHSAENRRLLTGEIVSFSRRMDVAQNVIKLQRKLLESQRAEIRKQYMAMEILHDDLDFAYAAAESTALQLDDLQFNMREVYKIVAEFEYVD